MVVVVIVVVVVVVIVVSGAIWYNIVQYALHKNCVKIHNFFIISAYSAILTVFVLENKLIAIEIALPFTTANEIRCINQVRSYTSSMADALRLPRLPKKLSVNLPSTPNVWTIISWKSNLSVRDAYLNRFQNSASLEAALT